MCRKCQTVVEGSILAEYIQFYQTFFSLPTANVVDNPIEKNEEYDCASELYISIKMFPYKHFLHSF